MFGPLGLWELIFILVIALLLFGPKGLPEIGRTLGKAFSEFRRASEELKRTLNTEISALDEEQQQSAPRPALVAPRAAAPGTSPRGSLRQPVLRTLEAEPGLVSDPTEGPEPPSAEELEAGSAEEGKVPSTREEASSTSG